MTDRWPSKPPKNTRCDAHIGWSSDRAGKPIILRCENQAVETTIGMTVGFETWLCQECADHMVADGTVKRNPKRR